MFAKCNINKRKRRGLPRGAGSVLNAILTLVAATFVGARAIAGEPPTGTDEAHAAPSPSAAESDASQVLTLPVVVSAVYVDGKRVVDDAWIQKQWAAVDRLYAGFGIRFERRASHELPEKNARLETKEDRDALGEHFVDGVVNVFFVKALMDIDEIGRIRQGVCWRAPKQKRFVAVASNAGPTVLAHELGHLLGNGHSKVVDNVMSYDRSGGPVFFDSNQKKTMRRTALQLLRDGIVKGEQP
jgi:hypothetical protein